MYSERRVVERGLAAFAFLAPVAFYDRLRFFESTAVSRPTPRTAARATSINILRISRGGCGPPWSQIDPAQLAINRYNSK